MNRIFNIILTVVFLIPASFSIAKSNNGGQKGGLYFIENRGQIKDQHSSVRADIQFAMQTPGMNLFAGNGQLHYQFYKNDFREKDLPARLMREYVAHKDYVESKEPMVTVSTYRMDVELVGANINAPYEIADVKAYYENYYLDNGPEEGIRANTFGKITYKNVYENIDWVIYLKGDQLEHEFVIKQGGDASKIKLRYTGQTSLKINSDGSITASTPMGTIHEQAPVCITAGTGSVSSSFQLNGNVLSYKVSKGGAMIIDPTLEWSTYYGPDSNNTSQYNMASDVAGNIYSCGLTYAPTTANVATVGAHQDVYGGNCDAFLIKFDTSGNRVWGTYYGGNGGDWANGCALDMHGNLFMLGTTNSSSAMSTPGSQQPANGGGWDAFLCRFTPAGTRIWGTYAGGFSTDYPQGIACDALGHVYISGSADSYNNIATVGSFRAVHGGGHDDFLIEYDTLGVRQWGTYFGGNSDDFNGVVSAAGYQVYVAGFTSSTTGIGTLGAHQMNFAGGTDAFAMRFNPDGTMIWGSYFGGVDPESVGGLTNDAGVLYLIGSTNSDTGIATPGCYQATRSGLSDAFLIAINPELGTRLWGTYFGGSGDENTDLSRISADGYGNVLINGYTNSTTGIATAGAWQTTFGGGGQDAFFAKFSPLGTIWWSTYFGGTGEELGRGCTFDGKAVYLCGQTNSPDHIATPGSFLSHSTGGTFYLQGFIAKFTVADTIMVSLSANSAPVNNEHLNAYPNPNKGNFTVNGTSGNAMGNVQIIVTDVAGRTVLNENALLVNGSFNKEINLGENAPAGTYLVKVVSERGVRVLQFVKD